MPELPEVETTRRGIAPHIEGKIVVRVVIRQPSLRWPVTEGVETTLVGQSILAVERRGKYLLIRTLPGTLLVHLGMSGSLRLIDSSLEAGKHDHVDIVFNDQTALRFNDPRRFGSVLWTSELPMNHVLLRDLGPEPLLPDFNGEWLYSVSRGRTASVKTFLMDSRVVVGIGNIYANEALFRAGIRPTRQAGMISRNRYGVLVECIRNVLEHAIVQGGTTLRNFVNESGSPGYFKQQLSVYGRGRENCVRCQTPLTEIRISNRSTVYCRNCQH